MVLLLVLSCGQHTRGGGGGLQQPVKGVYNVVYTMRL